MGCRWFWVGRAWLANMDLLLPPPHYSATNSLPMILRDGGYTPGYYELIMGRKCWPMMVTQWFVRQGGCRAWKWKAAFFQEGDHFPEIIARDQNFHRQWRSKGTSGVWCFCFIRDVNSINCHNGWHGEIMRPAQFRDKVMCSSWATKPHR